MKIQTLKDIAVSLGAHKINHIKNLSLLHHFERVSQKISQWGLGDDLIKAAYLHSVYGRKITRFEPILDYNKISDRLSLQDQIGKVSEEIIFKYCKNEEYFFWRGLFKKTLKEEDISNEERQLLHLYLANLIDHIGHNKSQPKLLFSSLFVQFKRFLEQPALKDLESILNEN